MAALNTLNNSKPGNNKAKTAMDKTLRTVGMIVLIASLYAAVLAVIWLSQSNAGLSQTISGLFAMGSVQAWWYITRAAGLTSYILLWLSMVWGMAIATKILTPTVEGTYSYDFHEFLSLLGLGFVLLHVIVLLLDKYLPFTIWQILIPFVDSYRPLWVGLGVIGFYIFLLVTVTFYMRQSIGSQAFRSIHMLSLLGYLGATLHGLFAGTDSALPVTSVIYAVTFLVVVFLTVYWFAMKALNQRNERKTAPVTAKNSYYPPRRGNGMR
jgi:sulfoxide reductase heme-binding subunit YedZ